jgi:hypothetical protein
MIKLLVSYTEQCGIFYAAYVYVDGVRVKKIHWRHELNDALAHWGIEFPRLYDDGAAQALEKAKEVFPFEIEVEDIMDIS